MSEAGDRRPVGDMIISGEAYWSDPATGGGSEAEDGGPRKGEVGSGGEVEVEHGGDCRGGR